MASERVYIDALSLKMVKVKCYDDSGNQLGKSNQMLATVETAHTLLTGPPSIIKFDDQGSSHTVMQNCGPFGLWIERNDVLGFAEFIEHPEKSE